MIYETKRINICDTKIFSTIAAVADKCGPDQTNCTHEMEFEFPAKQILLTKFPTYLPNLLISTSMNNNKTWEESQLLKTVPILTPIFTPIRDPS